MADRVIIGYEKFNEFVKSFKGRRKSKLLDSIGFALVNRFKRRMVMGNFKGISALTKANRAGKGGGKPLNDTGRLRSSITHVVQGSKSVAIGSPVTYAALMQEGGTIEPKKAKKLAIPVGRKIASMSKAKGVRGTLDMLKKTMNIWFTENAILGQKKGSKNSGATVLFIRKDKVVIPPRPYLFLDEKDELVVAKTIEQWYSEAL